MRTQEHIIDIIFDLKRIWQECPDLRLAQLLGNLNEDLYFVEDEKLIEKLEALYDVKTNKKTKR